MNVTQSQAPAPEGEGEASLPSLADALGFLFRWWRWAVIASLSSAALAAGMVALPQETVYEATVRVVPLRYRTAATFEPRIKTVGDLPGDSSQAAAAQNLAERRRELAELVVSPEIEREVVSKLGDRLPLEERASGVLSGLVKGEVAKDSGLIRITVSSPSPDKAKLIANTWANTYEQRINQIYIGGHTSLEEIKKGIGEAQNVYAGAEESLTRFVATSPLRELSRSVNEKEKLLTAADQAVQDAVTQLALAETKAKQGEVTQVLLAEAFNRAMALRKEQEAKNKVLSAYIDAAVEGKLAVIGEQVKGSQKELSTLYGVEREVGLLLERAQALQDDLVAGGGRSSSLALMLLRAQAFGAAQALPQLQLDSDALSPSALDQVADVQALIAALQQWRGRLTSAKEAKSQELLQGLGYMDVSSDLLPPALAERVRDDYLSLFLLGDVSQLSKTVASDNQLSKEAREQAARLMQLPSLQQALDLQLQKTEYDVLKARLEAQIREMNEKIAVESAKQKSLTLDRDIAWDSYTALSKKAQELQVELLSPQQTEVRVAGEAIVGVKKRADSPALVVALAAFLGLATALMVGLVAERIAAALPQVRSQRPANPGRE